MKYRVPDRSSSAFPFYFKLARVAFALLSGFRGEYFLHRVLKNMGALNKAGRFAFFDSYIHIPLDIPDTLYIYNFSLYEGLREINFANVIYRTLGEESTLIDCGAAFGQISCRLAKLCPNITNIISIEPNNDNGDVLRENLGLLNNKTTHLIDSAVSNFTGKGELCFPRGKFDLHAAYLRKAENGGVDVLRIDDLAPLIKGDIALKLDIEGGEIAAIEGAVQTISNAINICFFIEIHPEVLERTKHKAEDVLMAVSSIRNTKWILADDPLMEIDPNKPFFDQVEMRIYDVIGISTASAIDKISAS